MAKECPDGGVKFQKDLAQARNQLGTLGGAKSFLRGAYIF